MRLLAFGILGVLTVGLVVLTLLPVWRYERWWVRALDFPRLELAGLAVVLLILQATLLDFGTLLAWALILPTLLCFIYHAWWLAPYTFPYPREVRDAVTRDRDRTIRILEANVLLSNRDAGPFLRMIDRYEPDIVVAQEPDAWWQRRLDVLEADYPYAQKCPLDTTYGMLVYSRLPLEEVTTEYLVDPGAPSMHMIVPLRCGQRVRLHSVHPAPPSPHWSLDSTKRDAEMILLARRTRRDDLPVIVIGDMNDIPWSATMRLFRKISGLLDPRVGRGLYRTYHASVPFMRWPLDQVCHSPQFTLVRLECLGRIGSDHLPLLVELAFEPEVADKQNGLVADGAAKAWAWRKICCRLPYGKRWTERQGREPLRLDYL